MTALRLKPLAEQAVVIVGGSNGMGRVTARRFAEEGARVLAAAGSIWAEAEETTPEEDRQVIDGNLPGQIHGALAALPYLIENDGRGSALNRRACRRCTHPAKFREPFCTQPNIWCAM